MKIKNIIEIVEKTGNALWDFFASLKLTILLFTIITSASVAGTFMPGKIGLMKFLQGKPEWIIRLADVMELHDIYNSPWFAFFIIMLGVNIVCCSFERLPGVWKIVRKKPLPPSGSKIESLKNKNRHSSDVSLEEGAALAQKYFKKNRLKVYENKESDFYSCTAEKGRWTRFGVYITHLGFLLLITGGLIGNLTGFTGVMEIPENETESTVTLFDNQQKLDLNFTVTCNYFEIVKYDRTNTPKSYESEIIFNKGEDDEYKDIVRVNKPLRFNNIKFIQSGYGRKLEGKVLLSLHDIKTDEKVAEYEMNEGDTVTFPDGQTRFNLFTFRPNFNISRHNLGETFLGIVLKNKKQIPAALPVNNPGFDKHRRGDFYLKVNDFNTKYYTSLQVNKDQGVYLVYSGFLILLAGCFISFFMNHKSFYLVFKKSENDDKTEFIFASSSNKNKKAADDEVNRFYNFITGNKES